LAGVVCVASATWSHDMLLRKASAAKTYMLAQGL
jgi:hypothetical protein